MLNKETIHLSVRRPNGTFSYHSHGAALLDFLNRINRSGPQILVPDFSPILVQIHALSKGCQEQGLREKYNSMYNYWQDAKTYKKEAIVIARSESLSKQCNDLIAELEFRLQEKTSSYLTWNHLPPHELENHAIGIKNDAEMFINSLLCFIQSKASVEVASFKDDFLLMGYAQALASKIRPIYNNFLGYSQGQPSLSEHSFLYQLAFERNTELSLFLEAIPEFRSSPGLKVESFELLRAENARDFDGNYVRSVSKSWPPVSYSKVNALIIFRELLFQIEAVIQLLEYLKADGIDWQPTNELTEQIASGIKAINQRK
jgi:hypothetical protein